MMWRSCAAVRLFPTASSAGTSGETPPFPCSPWHWAHANWTNVCAPAATVGSTCAAATVVVAPPPTVTVFAE